MTNEELNRKIDNINHESISDEVKKRRIDDLKEFQKQNNASIASEEKDRQQAAEASLKEKLKIAYMSNPVATGEDFERDYSQMKSDYLRGEAMKKNAIAEEGAAREIRNNF